MPELKPCPFCGGEAKIIIVTTGYSSFWFTKNYQVGCPKCSVGSKRSFESKFNVDDNGDLIYKHDGRLEAIEAWNKRVGE